MDTKPLSLLWRRTATETATPNLAAQKVPPHYCIDETRAFTHKECRLSDQDRIIPGQSVVPRKKKDKVSRDDGEDGQRVNQNQGEAQDFQRDGLSF